MMCIVFCCQGSSNAKRSVAMKKCFIVPETRVIKGFDMLLCSERISSDKETNTT